MNRREALVAAVSRARVEATCALQAVPVLTAGETLSEQEYRDALYEAGELMMAAVKLNRHLNALAALDGMGD